MNTPVTIAVTDHVPHDVSTVYEARARELHEMLNDCPGFLSTDTVRHKREHQIEYTIILRFSDQESAQNWEIRPDIAAKLKEITDLTGGAAQIVESAGLGLWVDHVPGAAPSLPPFWKRVILSVLGVYPTLLILIPLSRPLVSGMPQPLQTLAVVVVLAALLTWPIMPFLGKIFRPWLAKK
ncbi:hypothetical protein K3555_22650 (plasmid) [Leisingera sp. M527]|uniref:hypothetical protein n=1 Tax=Leisingera sp. M527 TaxID=2867014 RepID=UPI0021A72685|nr:hypothetical protein [Leisingera sp. M527]UWQ35333.1 hypothetical protein K3555_22650 [Leisingera sp. M527]